MNNPYFTVCLMLVLWMLAGCDEESLVAVEKWQDSNRVLQRYLVDRDSLRQGEYERFVEGVLRERCHYENDTLHGMRTLYDAGGRKEIEETYQNGSFAGPFRTYYPSGQVELLGQYVDNAMHGEWIKYYPTGQMMERVFMARNNENGPFVEYHENGQLKAEGTYANGDREHGLLKLYDDSGELMTKMMCDSGICHTIWSRENGDVDG